MGIRVWDYGFRGLVCLLKSGRLVPLQGLECRVDVPRIIIARLDVQGVGMAQKGVGPSVILRACGGVRGVGSGMERVGLRVSIHVWV